MHGNAWFDGVQEGGRFVRNSTHGPGTPLGEWPRFCIENGEKGHNDRVKRLSVHEAKARFSAVMREVEAGEIVIVTRHDKPVVEMRSVSGLPEPRLGAFAEPGAPHLSVEWSDEELTELFGDLTPGNP